MITIVFEFLTRISREHSRKILMFLTQRRNYRRLMGRLMKNFGLLWTNIAQKIDKLDTSRMTFCIGRYYDRCKNIL